MVDVAMDLAKYLNEQTDPKFAWIKMSSTDGPTNATTFVNDLPDGPNEALGISRYAGRPPDETFENPMQVRNPRVQFLFRSMQSNTALQRGEDVMKFLARIKDQVINGTKYQRVRPVGEPAEIGPDSSNRQRVVLNMEVSFYDTIG